jgi:hypothetical protein
MTFRSSLVSALRRPQLTGVAILAVIGFIGLAVLEIMPPAKPAPPPNPPLSAADPAIRLVETDGKVLQIYADVHQAKTIADNFDKAGAIVLDAGQALQHGVADDLKGVTMVRFKFRCEGVNRFQQDVMSPLVTLDLPLAALKGADYAKASGNDVLGLATSAQLGAPGSYDAANAWCRDAARSSKALCSKLVT